MSAVDWQRVGVQYPRAERAVLTSVAAQVGVGELTLVLGATGVGKTTLLRTINGAVPHSTGGLLTGRVLTVGRDTRDHRPRDLAGVVSMVPQRPADAFVADTVEAELAYGMECLGVAPAAMRHRVEQTLDLLGLAQVRSRPVSQLSAGQQQRVAIAAAVITEPQLVVLDEPTSALDPTSAEEVLAALHRLVHDLGTTVVLSEHRLERVVQFADRAVLLPGSGVAVSGSVAQVLADPQAVGVAPPVTALARLLGWSPLPVSIRQARALAASDPQLAALRPLPTSAGPVGPVIAQASGVVVNYGPVSALRGADLEIRAGQVMALMGRNGAGKSTLLECLVGGQQVAQGRVRVAGQDPGKISRRAAAKLVALVPADPGDALLTDRVDRELALADRQAGVPSGTTGAALDRLLPGLDREAHPRYLSCGQRLALAVATALPRRPQLLLLDEPTRGLDYPAKIRATMMLRELAAQGLAVLVVTHDIELAAQLADEVAVLAEGQVVASGAARELLTGQPSFAPQVAKIMGPGWLTVAEVSAALAHLPVIGRPPC